MKRVLFIFLLLLSLISMTGCSIVEQSADALENKSPTQPENSNNETIERPEDWSDETHSNDIDPNYETVFPQDKVNRIDIIISEEDWETMMADMTRLMGEFGEGQQGMGLWEGNMPQGEFPRGEAPESAFPQERPKGEEIPEGQMPQDEFPASTPNPEDWNLNEGENPEVMGQDGFVPPENMQPPEGGFGNRPEGDGFNMDFTDENPVWVTATIEFEGTTWEHVGIRFKGNSSLRSAWSSGNLKIPFKLDFDQFEDDYPEIDDQRFYGFKQLSLSSNFSDDSYLREKVTADIFRDFGVPSAHTAFYEVYVDYSDGPVYFGLYTMVEMVEDTVIKEQFVSDEGNIYKPEGTGATFAEGTFNEESFDKENNQEEEDYSDILSLFEALHAENRLTDPGAWREGLETVFDVDTFLRWLAVNTVVQNWDTYGVMSHNYFLYTDPEDGLITWIPWDNNMALSGSGNNIGKRGTLSLGLDEVTDNWPLIRLLMDDPIYKAQYETYLGEVVKAVFVPEEMTEVYQYYHELIAPFALAETEEATMLTSEAAFENSVQELIDHVYAQYEAVQKHLSD
jgi:spore coat protein H